MKTTIPWARVAAEGVIIVASILLAFAIDAAWESRKEATLRNEAFGDLRRVMLSELRQLEQSVGETLDLLAGPT
jgi:hypothetical protein